MAASTSNDAQIITDATYFEGTLAWDEGKNSISSDNIITAIIARPEDGFDYNICTLTSTEEAPFKLRVLPAKNLAQDFLDKYELKQLPAHLDPAHTDLYVFISKTSGTGLSTRFFDEVLDPLIKVAGIEAPEYEIVRTEDAESIMKHTRAEILNGAKFGRKQTIMLLSGDGGIVEIINGLFRQEEARVPYIRPVIVQFPLGTGNALFHSLHKPTPPLSSFYMQALRSLFLGTAKPLPMFKAMFSPGARLLTNEGCTEIPLFRDTLYGAVVASYGFHSTLIAESDTTEWRKHGAKRFGLVANQLLAPEDRQPPHAYKASITITNIVSKTVSKNTTLERKEHAYILASMVSNLEKTFTISPLSTPLDGQLRLIHFGPMSGSEIMKIMGAAYADGKHIFMDGVENQSAYAIRIDFAEEGDSKWRRVCIDGLIVSVEEQGFMRLGHVPKGSEAIDIVIDPQVAKLF